MKQNSPSLFAALLLLVLAMGQATAQVEWRISVKFIVDGNGNRPSGGIIDTDQDVQDQIDAANALIRPFSRGYAFRLEEVRNLSGFASLFNVPRDIISTNLAAIVLTNPASILWRDNMLNYYINAADGVNEGITKRSLITMGHNVTRETFTHEAGHYLGLCHTHGCDCESCTDCVDPSDGINDTLPDSLCWNQQDQMATNSYGAIFASLPYAQQVAVSNTFNNIMCYHASRKVFTSDQMDHITDISNTSRSNLVTAFTRFVDRTPACANPDGNSSCTNGGPYARVADGLSAARAGDIVLIRPGNYNEAMTVRKAITFRATRGDAVVGKP